MKVLKSGEKVIVDPEMTIQRISLWFYWSVNMGAFFGVPTTYAARLVGYWLAFLLPGKVTRKGWTSIKMKSCHTNNWISYM
jgi:proton-dependent oligopeptide transporter, POT family